MRVIGPAWLRALGLHAILVAVSATGLHSQSSNVAGAPFLNVLHSEAEFVEPGAAAGFLVSHSLGSSGHRSLLDVDDEDGDVQTDETEAPEEAVDPEPEVIADPSSDVTEVEDLGYIVLEGVDYIPGPEKMATVTDVGVGQLVDSVLECAEACEGNPSCNIAAFLSELVAGANCYIKSISPGCEVPSDTDALAISMLLVSTTNCNLDVAESAAPGSATSVTNARDLASPAQGTSSGNYTQFEGYGYIATDLDIGPGLLVDDAVACEAECDAVAECNAASFTAELHRTGKNCFLRTQDDACETPSNSTATPNAVLSLNCDLSAIVPAGVADSPTGAGAPLGAEDDMGISGAVGATEAGSTSRETTTGDSTADPAEVADGSMAPASLVASLIAALIAVSTAIAMVEV